MDTHLFTSAFIYQSGFRLIRNHSRSYQEKNQTGMVRDIFIRNRPDGKLSFALLYILRRQQILMPAPFDRSYAHSEVPQSQWLRDFFFLSGGFAAPCTDGKQFFPRFAFFTEKYAQSVNRVVWKPGIFML